MNVIQVSDLFEGFLFGAISLYTVITRSAAV